MHHDLKRLLRRARIVRCIRDFFHQQDFVEVDTPVAQRCLAPEPHIEAPAVFLNKGHTTERRFLQTSPELPMKRLLAMGLPRIFQLAPCFRDGDFSPLHRPEFRLLEWYRNDAKWHSLLDDCEQLLRRCAQAAQNSELEHAFKDPFRRLTVEQAFQQHANFSLLECVDGDRQCSRLRQHLDRLGLHHHPDDAWDDLFFRVFLNRVEPAITADPRPFFLTHYPTPLASLAQVCNDDPRAAERFELYVGGIELANGYGELICAQEQRRRFANDAALRKAKGMASYPSDERFFNALENLDAAAGIALGLERLVMVLLGATDIDDVAFIAWNEQD